jgi:hypothetical protein
MTATGQGLNSLKRITKNYLCDLILNYNTNLNQTNDYATS